MEQQKYASLTTLREQYIKQYRQTIVSLKGICQAWGLNISKGISGKARLKDLIENHAAFPEKCRGIRSWNNILSSAEQVTIF